MTEPLQALFSDKKLNPKTIRMSVISHWLNENKLPLEQVQELADESGQVYRKVFKNG